MNGPLTAVQVIVTHHPVHGRAGKPGLWGAQATFLDTGFAEANGRSTAMDLYTRYPHSDLGRVLDTLLEDARRLGVGLRGVTEGETPTLDVRQGDPDHPLPAGWPSLLAEQAARLGMLAGFDLPATVQGKQNATERLILKTARVSPEGAAVVRRMLEGDPMYAGEWEVAKGGERKALIEEAAEEFYKRRLLHSSVFREPPRPGQTAFVVRLESVGNPDFRQDPTRAMSPPQLAYAATLSEASAICRQYIGRHQLGGGNWPGAKVSFNREGPGMDYALISHGGGVWTADDARAIPDPDLDVPAGTLLDRQLAGELYVYLVETTEAVPVDVNAAGTATFLDAPYGVYESHGDAGAAALTASVAAVNLRQGGSGSVTLPDGSTLTWRLVNGLELDRLYAKPEQMPAAAVPAAAATPTRAAEEPLEAAAGLSA